MKRRILPFAFIGVSILCGCTGVVRIAGQSDDLEEGGAVVVCYPSRAIPNISSLSIESWQYPLLGQRVEPDSAGRFAMDIRIRRASKIVILSGPLQECVTVDKGDSLHFTWRRGDSTMQITGRQKAFGDVAGYYDNQVAPRLRDSMLQVRYKLTSILGDTITDNEQFLQDTALIDSVLLLRDYYITLERELLQRFGAQPFALERAARRFRRQSTVVILSAYRLARIEGTNEQLFSKSDFPKRDQALSWYYRGLEEWENTKRAQRYEKRGIPKAERQWYYPPKTKKTIVGVLAASTLVRNGDGDLLYDSLRYAKKLSNHAASAGERHPAVQLHRMVYEARMAWLREPYQRFEYNKEAQPLDSILARSHGDSAHGYAVWLWLEDDDEFIRNAKALATAERALKRMGVRSVYVPFYEGESLAAFTMYRLGLKEPFATITQEGRTQLLHYLDGKPLRRSRCLLFDRNGHFVTADLPGSVEANRLAERVEKALEKN